MDGMNVLRVLHKLDAQVPVVTMTGISRVRTVVDCMRAGATDYVTKPLTGDALSLAIARALVDTDRTHQLVSLRAQLAEEERYADIVGRSPKMRSIFEQVERLCGNQTSVLIMGESGTGKEMVARTIHKSHLLFRRGLPRHQLRSRSLRAFLERTLRP